MTEGTQGGWAWFGVGGEGVKREKGEQQEGKLSLSPVFRRTEGSVQAGVLLSVVLNGEVPLERRMRGSSGME